jgi:hypothetical protein
MNALAHLLLLVDDGHRAVGRDADEGPEGARLRLAAQNSAPDLHRMGHGVAHHQGAAHQRSPEDHTSTRHPETPLGGLLGVAGLFLGKRLVHAHILFEYSRLMRGVARPFRATS